MNTLGLVVLALIAVVYVQETEAWWWGHRHRGNCKENHGGQKMYPYYFGTTDLSCLLFKGKKGKRSTYPNVNTWSWSHRYLKYQGSYFDFNSNSKGNVVGRPPGSNSCSASTSSSPAGYAVLSIDCMMKCAINYRSKYGAYNFISNNCHDFVNRMSNVLCNYNSCPSWC